MKPAFSTVACPHWTLSRLAERLRPWGFLGAELRTFGNGSKSFACDPALTDAAKVRAIFDRAGVDLCSLATGIRYDEAITPPVIGRIISDTEKSVRETRGMVELAVQLECPYVRVFGFELPEGEPRKAGLARIVDRLKKAADHCRNSGVKLALENGGTFPRSADLAEIIDAVNNPLLVASYSVAIARAAGEDAAAGVNVLGDRLALVKVKDLRGGSPVALGEGDLDCRAGIEALARAGYKGWLVYEFDQAWLPVHAADLDSIMQRSCAKMFEWSGVSRRHGAAATRV
ncbi:MAG TPA: sugar phosphate isomerase/epimerase family protein [Phycisphaerales bacterium]|nr:sugar phosphate isomerase/epimerase family protein [Phycisphaerales bacterium]